MAVELTSASTGKLTLDITAPGRSRGFTDNFLQDRGDKMLIEFLAEAGLQGGGWKYAILGPFRTNGNTPRVQVRRFDEKGVHVWIKPGSNNSGIKGVLSPPKGGGAVVDIYNDLVDKAAELFDGREEEEPVKPIETKLPDNETVELFLLAVDDAGRDHHPSLDRFFDRVVEEFPTSIDLERVKALAEELLNRRFLEDRKTFLAVSPSGRSWLESGPRPVAGRPSAGLAPAPAAPPPPVEVPPPPPAAPQSVDPFDLLEKSKAKMQRLMAIGPSIQSVRGRIADLEKKRDEIETQLVKERKSDTPEIVYTARKEFWERFQNSAYNFSHPCGGVI